MPRILKKSRRERDIAKVSVVGIIVNALLGGAKLVIGLISGSIAVISDAVNNLTDTSSSIITIVGTHLATRQPDRKHPFGYGRVEYMTSLVIGLIVFLTGVEMCSSSIKSIIHPHHVSFNYVTVIVLVVTVICKIFLGQYTLKRGRKLESGALVASGLDARSDAVSTGAALLSVILDLWFHIDIDAWVGAIISLYIVWTGFTILRDTVSKLVGEATSVTLAKQIYAMVEKDPMVLGVHDLILNNYGPDFYVGSLNVEVDHNCTAEEIYRTLHKIQQKLYHHFRAIITLGIYAVDKSSPLTAKASKVIEDFCKSHKGCRGFHALFIDEETHQLFCDLELDYGPNHEAITTALERHLHKSFPDYTPVITIDTPFVE